MLMLLVIGGLLGTLVLSDVFDSNDAPATDVDEDPPAPEGINLVLTADSDAILNGTDGNDTLTSEGPTTSTGEVYLGGGDDVATVGGWGADIYGGEGNDTMTTDGPISMLYGMLATIHLPSLVVPRHMAAKAVMY